MRHLAKLCQRLMVIALVLTLCATGQSAAAKGLLRDPDIERALAEVARPILIAAGLSPARVRILIINDSRLNAFVIDPSAIYIHSGLILRMENAAQLQSVIAHEAAHIANGHISRRIANRGNANTITGLGLLLAGVAAASGVPGGLAGGLAAGASSAGNRTFLAHTRAEESSADQSAVRYMLRAGVPTKGSVEVLDLFRGQEALSVGRRDPYASTHPLTNDRIRAMKGFVAANPGPSQNNATSEGWFIRAKGKLSAFLRNTNWTLRRAKSDSDTDLMRRAVAHHRTPNTAKATQAIAQLVARRPNDPYYRELQGQILLESRQIDAAVTAYGNAVRLAPNDALILGGYGRALLAQNTSSSNRKALQILEKARGRDFRDARILRDLGTAYARAGQNGKAALAGAERLALAGRLKDAAILARRAVGQLPRGSASWNRAQDILRAGGG